MTAPSLLSGVGQAALTGIDLKTATVLVLDTETTDKDAKNARICEVSALAYSLESECIVGMFSTLVHPECVIPADVSAIHGISNDDVKEAPTWDSACEMLEDFARRFDCVALVGHNIEYDREVTGGVAGIVYEICTERIAHHLWPDDGSGPPNYKLGTLKFWQGFDVDTFGIASHRGLADTIVAAELLRLELDLICIQLMLGEPPRTIEQLAALSAKLYTVNRWPFGKHYHERLADTPGYCRWALSNMHDLKPDLRASIARVLSP